MTFSSMLYPYIFTLIGTFKRSKNKATARKRASDHFQCPKQTIEQQAIGMMDLKTVSPHFYNFETPIRKSDEV